MIEVRFKDKKLGTMPGIIDLPIEFWERLPWHPLTRSTEVLAWCKAGNDWEPDLHFTGVGDKTELRFLANLLCLHSDGVVAHCLTHPSPQTYSLELQFGKSPEARQLMHQCRDAYHKAFRANGKLKPGIAKTFKRAG